MGVGALRPAGEGIGWMSTVLVTGGTGFLGSNIADVLTQRGHTALVGTRAEPNDSLPWAHRVLDYGSAQALEASMDGIDAVVHCAIANDFNRLQEDRRYAYDSYAGVTSRLINAAGDRPFIFISSDWVMDGTGHLVPEDEPVNPVNIYGVLKALSEQVVREHARTGAVIRVGGIMGAPRVGTPLPRSQDVGFGYFVTSLVQAVRAGEPFTVWHGPGVNEVATPSLASEIAAGIGRLIESFTPGIYHFVSDDAVSREQLAQAAVEAFDLDASLVLRGPVPPEGVFPAPVPVDTSLGSAQSKATLGLAAAPLSALLEALRIELDTGELKPLTS